MTTSGLQRWVVAFKSVDWVIPAYIQMGFLSQLVIDIENAEPSNKQAVLEDALVNTYDPMYLSAMLLEKYSKTRFIGDFKTQIAEAIEASFSGLYHAAIATMIPVLEGVIRKISQDAARTIGSGTKKMIAELDILIDNENNSPNRFDERVAMFEALRDFFAEKFLIETSVYSGSDQFNRHGILHGIFESYGVRLSFLKTVSLLDLLCFVVGYLYGGVSMFVPPPTQESFQLGTYYVFIGCRKPQHIRSILLL